MSRTRKNRNNCDKKQQVPNPANIDLDSMRSYMFACKQDDGPFYTLFNGTPEEVADLIISCIVRLKNDTGLPLNAVLEDIVRVSHIANAQIMKAADKDHSGLFAFDVPPADDGEEDQ